MIGWLLEKMVQAQEKRLGVKLDYAREMGEHAPSTSFKMAAVIPIMSHRKVVPADMWHMAQIAAVKLQDCGPCVQIAVNFALADRVPHDVVQAALDGGADLTGDCKLGFDYGIAVAQNGPGMLDLMDQVEQKFGKAGLIDMALTVAFAAVYPTLKRGIGHGLSCSEVQVVPTGTRIENGIAA